MVDFVDEGTYITRIEAAKGKKPDESYRKRKEVSDIFDGQ